MSLESWETESLEQKQKSKKHSAFEFQKFFLGKRKKYTQKTYKYESTRVHLSLSVRIDNRYLISCVALWSWKSRQPVEKGADVESWLPK